MGGAPAHDDLERADTLAAGLQRAAVGRRLEHEHRAARERPLLDQRPRRVGADLLVGREQQLDTRRVVERGDGVDGLHDAGLHVEHPRAGGATAVDRRTAAPPACRWGTRCRGGRARAPAAGPRPTSARAGRPDRRRAWAGRPSHSPIRPATASADRVIAATSLDGDSTFTSRARSASANSVSSASDDTASPYPAPSPRHRGRGALIRAAWNRVSGELGEHRAAEDQHDAGDLEARELLAEQPHAEDHRHRRLDPEPDDPDASTGPRSAAPWRTGRRRG